MKKTTHFLCAFLSMAAPSMAATTVIHHFNSAGVNHGWTAANATGAGQATGIDGTSGVFTSTDVTSIDPMLNYNSGTTGATLIELDLGSGETWKTFTFRFRQLTANPPGGTGATFSVTGTLIFFNGSLQNLNATGANGISSGNLSGTGPYAGDTYGRTLTAQAGGWQIFTIDLTNAPTLNSQNINSFRFDPVGNDAAKNFEIDYATFIAVPEPSSALLGGLGLLALLRRRR